MLIEHEYSFAQVLAAYAEGQRYFKSIEVIEDGNDVVLADSDLSGSEFVSCWFHSASFVRMNLADATFSSCNLKVVDFTDCNLDRTQWIDCVVCSIEFVRCSTTGIAATDLDAYGARIEGGAALLEYATRNLRAT